MFKTYSIAEARNQFTSIVRNVEASPAEITRHGEPVAVLLSWQQYQRITVKKDFWDSYCLFREQCDLSKLGIDSEIFEDIRDQSPGRDVNL